MAETQLARGLWANFTRTEDPFSEPNGMEANLRLIDDHLGLYTLQPPLPVDSSLDMGLVPGTGQIFEDGTYAVFNADNWCRYPARRGIRAVLVSGTDSWDNTGAGWTQFSAEVSKPAIAAITAIGQEIVSDAEAAKDAAESARDGALAGAHLYPDEPSGRAAVGDGETFNVQGAGDIAAFQYRRVNADVSTLIAVYPSNSAVLKIGRTASAADELSIDRLLSARYAHVIVDSERKVVEGVARVPGGSPLTARHVVAFVVGDSVVASIERNGAFVNSIPLQLFGSHAVRSLGGARMVVDGAVVDALLGDVLDSRCNASIAEVIRDSQAGPRVEMVDLLPVTGVASEVTDFQHFLGYGQSLSLGGGAEPVATTSPPSGTRLFSPVFGVRLDDQAGVVGSVTPLKPLISNSTEVPIVQAAAQLLRNKGLSRSHALCVSAHGRGGASIDQLQKGSTPYANLLKTFADVRTDVVGRGFAYRQPVIDLIQGESDYASSSAAWTASMNQLRADLLSDFAAVDAGISKLPFVLDQISNWTAFNAANSAIPFAQLALALSDPLKVYCAGPKYWLPTNSDGVHLTPLSSSLAGCMHTPVLQAAANGTTWLPVHAVAARRTGRVIDVEFHVPFGVLAVDTQAVSDPGNLGLRFVDTTSSASIESVQLLGRNRVRCTLNADPTGASPYIGIADTGTAGAAGGPTTGPRSCLRDSVTHEMYGSPVFFFACHQRISVE